MSAAPALYTRAFAVACAMHFAGGMSLAMFLLFPLFVKALGGDELTIGLVLGVGTAASVAARPAVGLLLDRVGRRRVLLWGNVLNAASWVPFWFLAGAGPWLYVWSTAHEIVWGALFAAYFTYAADLAPPARRAEGIAVFGVAGMASNGLAPLVGERVIAAAGYGAFFAVAVALALVSVGMTLLVRDRVAPTARAGAPASLADVVRIVHRPGLPRVLGASVVLGVAINAAYFFVAPFTRVVGVERAAPFFVAYAATSIVVRLLGRRVLDALGPHRVSLPGFALFTLGLGTLAALGPACATAVLVASGIACGAAHGSLFPVLNALAIARVPAAMQGAVVGLHTAALDLGAVVGTLACGAVADRAGYPTMYVLMGVVCVAGLGLMATDTREP